MSQTVEHSSPPIKIFEYIEDTFSFPKGLLDSPKIRFALDLVTQKYVFYLQAAASYRDYIGVPDLLEGVYDKLKHTNDVIKAAIDAWEPGKGVTLEDTVAAAIYHDMFRSFQGFYFFDYNDGRTGFFHGEAAAKYIAENVPEEFLLDPDQYALIPQPDVWQLSEEERKKLKQQSIERKKNSPIVLAVENHSKLNPLDTSYLSLLLRDIDKIAIIRRIIEIQERLERTAAHVLASKLNDDVKEIFRKKTLLPDHALSPEIIPYLLNPKLIPRSIRKTKMDSLVYHLMWIWDLNTQKAREIFAAERLPEKIILHIITTLQPATEDVEKIQAMVAAWYKKYNLGTPDYKN